ncbi:nucleolar protein 10-like [Zophobas morio]|uniref:nucleolar protein 10-like n=1 Tax=Zophobas morio TaxID=2755281 RepID=UPI00308285CD
MAVGTSVGKVFLYDIRSRIPLLIKEHPYEFPIKKIIFHYHSRNIVSADKKVIKFWNEVSGNSFTSVEQEADLNDFCIPGSSGLILTANETPKMNVFYIPDLGSAPKWCHHLDGITEELEENYTNSIYEDYKFIERSELAQLGLESLIGSNHLRPYMHGFFINKRLYREVYSATQPFLYEQYRKAQIEKKLQEKRENRIGVVKKLPKVNKKLALKLLESRDRSSEKPPKSELLHDERFKSLWNDADFEIDVESEDYKLRHRRRDAIKVEEQFQPESFSSSEILEDDEINLRIPKMYELKDGVKFTEDIVQLESIASKLKLQEAPLGIRAQAEEEETTTLAPIRNRVITIQPQKSKEVLAREKAQKEHLKERKELRRSVKDLNLPKLKIGRKFYSKRK